MQKEFYQNKCLMPQDNEYLFFSENKLEMIISYVKMKKTSNTKYFIVSVS